MAPERSFPVQLVVAALFTLPGAYLGAADYLGWPRPDLGPPPAALVFGVAIVGAAFLLSWAAEAAQVDISAGLALALLALLAVLPEYAVDFVFTMHAGQVYEQQGACVAGPDGSNPCALALANMTGANRVLVGIGWPLVVLVSAVVARRARRAAAPDRAAGLPRHDRVDLAPQMSTEVVFLGIVTLYSLTLPLRTSLTMLDGAVLLAIFVAYLYRLAKAPAEDPDLSGTSAFVGRKPAKPRRAWVAAMLAVAALTILACAEHFADNLVATGARLGADPFLLVQWVAPLASESPELIVACLLASRLKGGDALGALLSSKVNQWSLLVGTIPIVFALSAWTTDGLPLDTHQRLELLLTATQSLFAVSILVNLTLSARIAAVLFLLFGVQFTASVTAGPEVNRMVAIGLSGLYAALALAQLLRRRSDTVAVVRDGLKTPFSRLQETD